MDLAHRAVDAPPIPHVAPMQDEAPSRSPDRGNDKPTRALKIAKEQGRYEEDGWRVRKDGTFFWASVVIDPIYEEGELVGFAKITRDITERRNTQLRLEQIQKQLAESQKLD